MIFWFGRLIGIHGECWGGVRRSGERGGVVLLLLNMCWDERHRKLGHTTRWTRLYVSGEMGRKVRRRLEDSMKRWNRETYVTESVDERGGR